MGKGSKRRPKQIDDKQFEDNWEKVFGNQRKKKTTRQTNKSELYDIKHSDGC